MTIPIKYRHLVLRCQIALICPKVPDGAVCLEALSEAGCLEVPDGAIHVKRLGSIFPKELDGAG